MTTITRKLTLHNLLTRKATSEVFKFEDFEKHVNDNNSQPFIVDKKDKVRLTTYSLYFDMSREPFTTKDVMNIGQQVTQCVNKIKWENNVRFNVHVYLLVSGKASNTLPLKAKDEIQALLDNLNKQTIMELNYSCLSNLKSKYDSIQKGLNMILKTSEFSDENHNDSRVAKNKVQNSLTPLKNTAKDKSLPVQFFVNTKLIRDLIPSDTDLLINVTKEELLQNIQYSKSSVVPLRKKSKRSKTPSSVANNLN